MKIPDGLVVRIPRSHRGGPGSIPGQGTNFFIFSFFSDFPYRRNLAISLSTAISSHGSIVVSIPRCGRGDPGSTPGRGRVTLQTRASGMRFNVFVSTKDQFLNLLMSE